MISFHRFGHLGRFGNQLFQYAGTRLYAERFGYQYALPDWIGCHIFDGIYPISSIEKLKTFFNKKIQLNDLQTYTKKDIIPWLLSKNQRLPHTYSMEYMYTHQRDRINFYGYMQDEYSFDVLRKNRNTIKQWFRLKKEIGDIYRFTTKDLKPWIGLHIRQGDFIKIGVDLPISAYREQLDVVIKNYPDHKIFIATNAPEIKKEFAEYDLLEITNPSSVISSDIFDFWMLSQAAVVISGGSTFSWWAAFLGNNDHYYSAPLTHLWDEEQPKFCKRII